MGEKQQILILLFWFFDQCVHITRIVDDVLGHAERGRRREREGGRVRGYVYQRARFERGPRHSGYLSGEIENRETNGNKSKLLRASLQACFACNCSNLRKHSLSLHFTNLIMMIIIRTITWSMFFVQFFFWFLFSPNTCLFTHPLHKVGPYTHISVRSILLLLLLLPFSASLRDRIEPNSPSVHPPVRPSVLSIFFFFFGVYLSIYLFFSRCFL